MQSILEVALEKASASAVQHIYSLRLRVGSLTGVVPEALEFAFQALRQDTLAAEAQLEIETVPVTCWCQSCQIEFQPEDYLHDCPQCRQPTAEIRHGLELELVSMETS